MKTLRKLVLFLILLMLPPVMIEASYPVVRNFSHSIYSGGSQNWAIAQDCLGRMYFGNRDGLLQYDSKTWTASQMDNYSTIRSILIDESSGRIYVGGSEDFGYFCNDGYSAGLSYCSLYSMMSDDVVNFKEIWNIHRSHDMIWFQGDFGIFRYDGKAVEAIPVHEKITTSALINGDLYVALQESGLSKLSGIGLERLPGGESLAGKKVCAILPFNNQALVVTAFDGIFLYDGVRITQFATDIDYFLKENQVFCAATDGRHFAFGTVNNGVVIKDFSDGSNTYANVSTGLQNNTVLALFFDSLGNLWLGLDNGIDYVVYNSQVNNLLGSTNIYGAGYASLLWGNVLYLGTNQGLYMMRYPFMSTPVPPVGKKLLSGQVWNLSLIDGMLFVCSDVGLFYMVDGELKQITGVPGTWALESVGNGSDKVLVSTYDHFYMLHRDGGKWISDGIVEGYDDVGGRFVMDGEYVWTSHWMKGVYRLHLDAENRRFDSVGFYDNTKGLPANQNNSVGVYNGHIIVSADGGYYELDRESDRMVLHPTLNAMFGGQKSAHIYVSMNQDIWSVSPDDIRVAEFDASGQFAIDSSTFKPLGEKLIAGFDNFNFVAPEKVIVSNQDGFYEVVTARKIPCEWHGPTFVSRVYVNQDSLIYSAAGPCLAEAIKLPYDLNSLKFEFVQPEYRMENGIKYSFRLDNYDADWSAFSSANSKEYTQLHEGTYTLQIRSVNMYDEFVGEGSFTFTILPPWYRSIVAKICYLIAFVIVGYVVFQWLRSVSRRAAVAVEKRKEEEMARMKRQSEEEALRKDYEIAHLRKEQLEHDIKHKSEELSNTTMNVIRKNEILLDIAGKLTKIQQSTDAEHGSQAVARQLAKIQHLIQENISHDDDWRNFTHNFDIVYDNFTKRLVAQHPQLTDSDQRLCCYLKMGLSSKEIAPLINISYRSVEMSRYRLRKKMNLDREVNLVDYLQRL